MLLTANGKSFQPMFDINDDLMMFADEREAVEAANGAWRYGYEIFCEGCGEKSKP